MKTLKISIFTMIALCALLFVFVGCESTENSAQEENAVVSEVTPEVPAEKEDKKSEKKEDDAVASKISLLTATAESLTGGWTLYTMEDKDGEYPISCAVTMSFN